MTKDEIIALARQLGAPEPLTTRGVFMFDGELLLLLAEKLTAQPAAPAVVDGPSPLYFNIAIDLLNKIKAWRDCDGNDGFPPEVREHIDALLMAVEVRTTGTFAQQVARNLPTPPEGPQS